MQSHNSFPHLDWSGLELNEWIVVAILTTLYTASTLYACFAFLILNRQARIGGSVYKQISLPEGMSRSDSSYAENKSLVARNHH